MITVNHEHLHTEREQALTQALRTIDPEAVVHIDRNGGQLSVSTVLGESEVLAILEGLGVDAAPVRGEREDPHATGGCCGGCGCG